MAMVGNSEKYHHILPLRLGGHGRPKGKQRQQLFENQAEQCGGTVIARTGWDVVPWTVEKSSRDLKSGRRGEGEESTEGMVVDVALEQSCGAYTNFLLQLRLLGGKLVGPNDRERDTNGARAGSVWVNGCSQLTIDGSEQTREL